MSLRALLLIITSLASTAHATHFFGVATHARWEGWVNTTSDLSLTAPPVQFGDVRITCFDGRDTWEGLVKTNALGRFSWDTPAAASTCASMNAQVLGGTEEKPSFSSTGYNSWYVTIGHAPYETSPDRSVWARRVTAGRFAVFFIEGYDPDDTMKTGPEASAWLPDGGVADSLISLMRLTPVGTGAIDAARSLPGNEVALPGRDLLSYLAAHDYSLYLLTAAKESRRSIRGSTFGGLDGQAYQTAALIRMVMDRHTAQYGGSNGANGQPFANPGHFAVGGYSMGGLVAKYALKRWCGDEFLPVPENLLRGDHCDGLAMWFAGDSPLRGAQIPVALQRLIVANDGTIGVGTGEAKKKVTADAAREMLTFSFGPDDNPDTNCKGTGCDSSDWYFTLGDDPTSDVHTAFQWEVNGPVVRSGSVVPAFIFAAGPHPLGGTVPGCWSVGKDAKANSAFFAAEPLLPGSIILRVDNGYGDLARPFWGDWSHEGECVPGSTWTPPMDSGTWTPMQKWAFIPSASALEWDVGASGPPGYADYWFSQGTRDHTRQLPAEATSVLTAWLDESLKGLRSTTSVPVTGALPGFGKVTRFVTVEDASNGIDDDGDDNIDNLAPDRSRSFFLGGATIPALGIADTASAMLDPYSSSCFPLGGVTVSLVGLQHTWASDLKAELLHLPWGAGLGAAPIVHPLFGRTTGPYSASKVNTLTLHFAARVGSTFQTAFSAQPTGTTLPIGAISSLAADGFATENSCGQWWVRITDMVPEDFGAVSSWRLTLSQDLYR